MNTTSNEITNLENKLDMIDTNKAEPLIPKFEAKNIQIDEFVKSPSRKEKNKPFDSTKVVKSLLIKLLVNILSSLSFQLFHIINLICLVYYDPTLFEINSLQLGEVFMKMVGFNFVIKSITSFEILGRKAYKSGAYDQFYTFFNHAKTFSILIFIILILPWCFVSDYILTFIQIDENLSKNAGLYVKWSLISMLLSVFNSVNFQFLSILSLHNLVLSLNLIIIAIHLILAISFIIVFKLGVIGAGISMIISYLFLFFLSSRFVQSYNPCKDKSFSYLDTSSLSSINFYYYVRSALPNGILGTLNYLIYDLTVLTAAYLDIQSLSSNVISYNIVQLGFLIIFGISNPLTLNVSRYVVKKNQKNYLKIKVIIIFLVIISVIFSSILYYYSFRISYIFIDDQITSDYVGNILVYYSRFIFFDWAYKILIIIIESINYKSGIKGIISFVILVFFFPLGLLFTFSFNFGYAGFWYSNFISMVLLTIIATVHLMNLDFHPTKKHKNKLE